MVCFHVIIRGKVQGVFFRMNLKEEAGRLGIKGWVRNLPSGEVEALLEGNEDAVNKLLDWCNHGSPSASVEDVQVKKVENSDFNSFEIRY